MTAGIAALGGLAEAARSGRSDGEDGSVFDDHMSRNIFMIEFDI